MRNICCAVFLCVVFSTISFSQEMRTWTDQQGKTITGKLIQRDKINVTLESESGKTATVAIKVFSDQDQKYIENLRPYIGMELRHIYDFSNIPGVNPKSEYLPFMLQAIKTNLIKESKGKINPDYALRVMHVDQGMPAELAGIEQGDTITVINGKSFKSGEEYLKWSASNNPNKYVFRVWPSSDLSKSKGITVTPVLLPIDDIEKIIAKRRAEEKANEQVKIDDEKRKKDAEEREENVLEEFKNSIVGLKDAQDTMLALLTSDRVYDNDVFDGKIVPLDEQDFGGIEFLKNPRNSYGVIIRYKKTRFDNFDYYMLLCLKNTSDKAIKTMTFKGIFTDPKRSVPYGEIIFTTIISGGIEPRERRAVEFITTDENWFRYPPKELQKSMECQIQILGYTFYDDEEVGEDILHPSRQERK